jgi:urocanate hydratase
LKVLICRVARRSWAWNIEAVLAIKRQMERTPNLKVALANMVDQQLFKGLFEDPFQQV